MITKFSQLDVSKRYSYADYLTWQFAERVELIHGEILKINSITYRMHQQATGNIFSRINLFLSKTKCSVYIAPFDVRLLDNKKNNTNKNIYTVVQSDICVVCDESKLDDQGCIGSPDLIIEVVSPGNTKKEIDTKFNLYQENGVGEYWIVFPFDENVQIFDLINNSYQLLGNYTIGDVLTTNCLPKFKLKLSDIFYH
jgi:Uma2 family endonuclease